MGKAGGRAGRALDAAPTNARLVIPGGALRAAAANVPSPRHRIRSRQSLFKKVTEFGIEFRISRKGARGDIAFKACLDVRIGCRPHDEGFKLRDRVAASSRLVAARDRLRGDPGQFLVQLWVRS